MSHEREFKMAAGSGSFVIGPSVAATGAPSSLFLLLLNSLTTRFFFILTFTTVAGTKRGRRINQQQRPN